MKRAALIILALAIIFALTGCGKKTPEPETDGNNKSEKATVETTAHPPAAPDSKESGSPVENTASGEIPEGVIKTENRVSSQEANAVLDDLDKQLTELMNTLERLDDVKDEDLQY
ncbi:MAG TPA: hypothetical protein DCM26_03020 [Desulfotomaculum sp.]|nr:hypothetical protein [Desulfotomaculum sp.]